MDEKLRGTKTEQNLINAFAGEAQARNRYTYYSKIAKKEGYEQISEIFAMTADNELEHAKLFYQYVVPNQLAHVTGYYPFELGKTEENLASAIAGETEEYDVLYKESNIENNSKIMLVVAIILGVSLVFNVLNYINIIK